MKKYGRISLSSAVVIFIQICCIPTISMAQDGRLLLVNAFEASKKASFSSTLKNPFPKKTSEEEILPHATNWKFYRSFYDGVVYIRLEASAEDKIIETYLKNKAGIYGVVADGFAAEIIEVPMLWFPELTHLEISPEEIELSTFSVTQGNYNNVPCYRIIMKTPKNDAALMKITGDDEKRFKDNRKNYLTKRVFIREFWVGRDNNLIYCRKHYNGNGALIFSVALGNVDFHSEISQSLFATPENVRGKFIERKFFASKALEKMIMDKTPSFLENYGKWFASFWDNNFDTITSWLSPIFAILGVGIFLLVIVIKVRGYRRR